MFPQKWGRKNVSGPFIPAVSGPPPCEKWVIATPDPSSERCHPEPAGMAKLQTLKECSILVTNQSFFYGTLWEYLIICQEKKDEQK